MKKIGCIALIRVIILIISGLFLMPCFRASKSKPNPRTPEGTKTLIGIIA